jgi:serine/threonine protein kinase
MIVGGNFNYQFDNNVPVVSPPEMASIRVVNIELSGSGLTLELWNPSEPPQQQQKNIRNNNKKKGKKSAASNSIVASASLTKKVHLNSQWRWYHCSPIGYLVTDAWTDENQRNAHDAKKCVFYYLPKHPLKWHAFGDTSVVPTLAEGPSAMLSPVAPAAGDDSLHHIYHSEDHEEHLMNCDESSILDDENEVIDVDVDVDGVVNENHQLMEEDDVEEGHDHEAVMIEDPVMFTQVIAANSFEQDAVMEQDDDDEAVIPMECEEVQRLTMSHSSKLPKSLMFRIMSWLDNQEIRTGFVTLNKTWTMAAYWYLLAQGPSMISLSKSGNGDDDGQRPKNVISSKRFETFLSHYSEGKFLGDGACKRVYLIGGVGRNTFALSIMDINDLNLRGVQSAIEQELRISILCSNLSLMNVCPNMIRVFEVFQTNADPSKIVWSCDPPAVVAKSSSNARRQKYEKGHFQFIRMEFCAGGDVESHLRKCHTFNADLIRSYLFQMCYSLYAGRESMSLRHYDIKLLNFFVTSGFEGLHVAKKYPEDSEKHHKEDSNSKGLQIGFGNHIYTLPIKLNQELSVIKLADFGTSVIGQEILNEPITPHQVNVSNIPL